MVVEQQTVDYQQQKSYTGGHYGWGKTEQHKVIPHPEDFLHWK